MKENLCVLGATGSIGLNTLDVATRHSDRYRVFAISANNDWKKLVELCVQHQPKYAVLANVENATEFEHALQREVATTQALVGADALKYIASLPEIDIVMAAIVGAAGLEPNLAAVEAGKKVLLANKESLVMSGDLFMAALKRSNATLLPIDSEHNAIFQCLPAPYQCGENPGKAIKRILLTASGGPFRGMGPEQLGEVSPEQACAHPNWSMGRKISVDSASLMNKGLELIEACWLFNVRPSDIEVHIHPESIVHSMVEYIDGSVLAQMGQPDMRTPIAYGMAWPERIDAGVESLDLFKVGRLNFERPDDSAFPCLGLAKIAFKKGGASCAYLNAANEIAVDAFLKGNIRFTTIPDIIERVLAQAPSQRLGSLKEVLEADKAARQAALGLISNLQSRKTG